MEIWIQNYWLYNFIPLGWALFHSLWQSFLIYSLLKTIQELFPSLNPKINYGLGLIFLASVFLLFWTGIYNEYSAHVKTSPDMGEYVYKTEKLSKIQVIPLKKSGTIFHFWESNSIQLGFSIWGLIYIICVIGMGLRLAQSLFFIERLKNPKNLYFPENELRELFNNLKKRIPFPPEAKLWLSQAITSPITFGYIKPIILFPIGLCTKLSISQIEGLLIHEMAHIIRKDYLFNFLQGLVETFLFFNPFVWLLNQEIRSEREKCCDDWVTDYYSDTSMVYAQTLLRLEEERQFQVGLTISALGQKNQLFSRIQRIMKKKETTSRYPVFTGIVSLFMGLGLLVLLSSSKFRGGSQTNNIHHNTKISISNSGTHKFIRNSDTGPNQEKEIENKKLKEIQNLEITEKNVEMDSMNKILSLKSTEISKLSDLIISKSSEIGDLMNRYNKKAISQEEYNNLIKLKGREMDSLNKIMEKKGLEVNNYQQILELKQQERDSLNDLIHTQGTIYEKPKRFFNYKYIAPNYTYHYSLPFPDTDRDLNLNPEDFSSTKNSKAKSRKLLRVQKKLDKLNGNELNTVLNESLKKHITEEMDFNKLPLKDAGIKPRTYAFNGSEKFKLNIEPDIHPFLDEKRFKEDLQIQINKNLNNNLDLENPLSSKEKEIQESVVKSLKNNLKNQNSLKLYLKPDPEILDKISKEVEVAKNLARIDQEKFGTDFRDKIRKEIENARNIIDAAQKKTQSEYYKKELEKVQEKLLKLKSKSIPDLHFEFDIHLDSNGHKDDIHIRSNEIKTPKN